MLQPINNLPVGWASGTVEVAMLVIAVLEYKLTSGTDWDHVFRKRRGRKMGQF